ncbi:MAG: hypothetical protein Q4C91_19495 [Eubacteriales bacterium]|nr:hypothetical protein [Eubacteriales bacterium]
MLDSADVRKLNRDKIRDVMRQGEEYTKQEIAVKTGLSVATCNTLLNDLESRGEVIGEKRRLNNVGRGTIVYHMNEEYESILCIHFDALYGQKYLCSIVLSPSGKILEKTDGFYDPLDYELLEKTVTNAFERYPNISEIMVGTPSIAEHGIIRHCDIPELEDEPLVEKLEDLFHVPVFMENDMHYKVYGYYRKEKPGDAVVTLANFPEHVLPGTATVYKGTIIKGKNDFAGMVGFLPYGISLQEQLLQLETGTCLPLISKAVSSIIAILNPGRIVFTGDLLSGGMVERIREDCLQSVPEEYMPEFSFVQDMEDYYVEGMYQRAMDMKKINMEEKIND